MNRYNYCAGNPVNYKDPSGNVLLAVELAKLGAAIGLVKGLCDAVKDAVEVGVDCYQNNKNFFEEYNWAAEGMHILNSTVSGAVVGGTLGMTGSLELSMATGEGSYELLQGLTDVITGAEDTKDLKNAKDVAGYVGKRVVKGAIRSAAEGALFDISLATVNPLAISSAAKMAFAGEYSAVGAVGMNAAADGRLVSDSELLTAAVTGVAGGYIVGKIGEGIGDKITDDAKAGTNMREKAKVYDPLSETDIDQRTGTTNQKIIDQSTGKNTGNNNLKEDVNVAQDAGKSDTCPLSKGGSDQSASGKTYYHITTAENAQKIIESGEVGLRGNRWESRVFAWTEQPTEQQANIAGIGKDAQTVIKFETNASFEPDAENAGKPIANTVVQTTDGQIVPISVKNVEMLDSRKLGGSFGKNKIDNR